MAGVTLEERPTGTTDGAGTPTEVVRGSSRHLSVSESITRGALALLSTQPLTWGASMLTAIALPRLLGADALGQVAIAVTIAGMTATVTGLGISEFLVRRVAQRPADLRHDLSVALYIQIVTAIIGLVVVGVFGPMFTSSLVNGRLLQIALLAVVGAPAQTVLLSSFRGGERHRNYAWFNAAGVVAAAVAQVMVLLAGGDVVQAQAAGGSLMICTTLVAWTRSGLRPSLPAVTRQWLADSWEFVRGGLPFLSWQLTLYAYGEIDKILLGTLVPSFEVGWYAAAYRVIGMTVFIPNLVMGPLFPALSRGANDPAVLRRTVAQTLRLLLLLMVPLCACTVAGAPIVPRLLGWPSDFVNAVPLMMVLALHLPVVAVDMVLGVVLMAIHREARWVFVGVVATVFNIGGNLLLIPYFQQNGGNGAIAAAIVTVLTEMLMCVGAVILIPKNLLDPRIAWQAARLTVAGLSAGLAGLAVQGYVAQINDTPLLLLVVTGIAAMATYLLAAAVLRTLTLADVMNLKRGAKWPRR